LGKPYLWGGNSPTEGFDCSGLVFYAFNHVLERKLPRTANGMYRDDGLKSVHRGSLKQGDLVFFNINQRPGADHVGVYLGDGRFIEAPRTGLKIRISQLSDDFWQSHYLGARRVL
jgi:cell wall-associated NlpC family hydrolase